MAATRESARRSGGSRRRLLVVAALALALAHAAAAVGLWRGMPEPLYGDEARYWQALALAVLETVWLPWRPLSPDAWAPAVLARAVIPVIVLWLCGELAAARMRNPLRLLAIRRRGAHTVLIGLSPLARTMLERWLDAGRAVLVLSAHPEDESYAVGRGAAFVLGDWRIEQTLERAGVARAAALWCVTGGDAQNIEQAVAAARHVRLRRDVAAAPLALLVHVDDPFLRARIDERIDRFAALETVQVRLFSTAQIAARRLFREHPVDAYRVRGAGRQPVWIFGFGSLGEEIALQLLRLHHRRESAQPALVIVDRDAERCRSSFSSRWPGAAAVAQLEFAPGHAEEGDALFARLLARGAPPAAAYFCTGAEERNLGGAMLLCAAFERSGTPVPPLYVRAGGVGSTQLGAQLSEHPWFRVFGSTGWVADEALMEERLDALARTIHERYLAEALARGESVGARRALRPWTLLPEDLKDDNRHLADHHFVKVRDAGAVALAGAAGAGFQWRPEEVEWLARVEHERWMAQRVLNGWKFSAVRDDARKLHPDMVAYAALPEERRELDRAAVREIPGLLAQAGFGLRRLAEISVSGPAEPCAPGAPYEQAIVALLEELRAGGREPLLWTDFEGDLACRAAELGVERGLARVGAIVRGAAARPARVRKLLALADRVVVEPAAAAPEPAAAQQLRLMLSSDGRDLTPVLAAWGVDAAGRVLFRPASVE